MNNSAVAHVADHHSQIRLHRLPEVQAAIGLSRANIYSRVARGLLPRPVKIGNSISWPSNEIQSIVAAHVAGKSEADIAALVRTLQNNRTGN